MASDATSGKTHASTVYAIFPLLTAPRRGRVAPVGGDPAPPIGSEDTEDLPATDDRFERVVADLKRRGERVTVDAVADRVIESIARETPVRFGAGAGADPDRLRAAVIQRARVVLDER